jgi:hypothetical protein
MRRNKPLSGEVAGDNIMDLYFKRMHQIYAAESHVYKKDVPRDFSKCMLTYYVWGEVFQRAKLMDSLSNYSYLVIQGPDRGICCFARWLFCGL